MNGYICPHCDRKFPEMYWGVSGRGGGYAIVAKPGLARANFNKHVKACKGAQQQKNKSVLSNRRIQVECRDCDDLVWEHPWQFEDKEAKEQTLCAQCEAEMNEEPVDKRDVIHQQPPRSRKRELADYKIKYSQFYK